MCVQDFASQMFVGRFYTCAVGGRERIVRIDCIISQNDESAFADVTMLVDTGSFYLEFPVVQVEATSRVPIASILLPIHVVPHCGGECAPPPNPWPAGDVNCFGLDCTHKETGLFAMNSFFIK